MTRVGLAKGLLAITGLLLFLWANGDEQQGIRWIAIGLVFVAFTLRFIERGERRSHRDQPPDNPGD